jgi:hypothetical protein
MSTVTFDDVVLVGQGVLVLVAMLCSSSVSKGAVTVCIQLFEEPVCCWSHSNLTVD